MTSTRTERDELVLLMGAVPERLSGLVSGLDEPRLAYRHAPAFPTLRETIGHLCEAGVAVDGLLRRACLDGLHELPVRATIDPPHDPDLSPPVPELLQTFARVRRRTLDLLRGLPPEAWERTVVDPLQGELTLLEVCRLVTEHELAHLSQLRGLIALLPAG
ncbi:MAG TPA: DinB family protein [Candidatus Dormibacteraeota bacterium]|nr:DinB family protein [Candidatus Dormibacteraeota bacterium]